MNRFAFFFLFAFILQASPNWAQPNTLAESSDKAVGCDCAKDDIHKIRQAKQHVLLPMSILLAHAGPPFQGNLNTYLEVVSECVEFATEILDKFKCGGCGDSFSYDCCCDSDAIHDHVKDTLNAIGLAVPHAISVGGMLGKTILDTLIEEYKESLKLAIGGIVDDYPTSCPARCPCFTLREMELIADESELHRCQFLGERRKVVDFDIVIEEDEMSYAFCVGDNCPKFCDTNYQGDCMEELPEENKCYSGVAHLGRPYPYLWEPGRHVSMLVDDDQYSACYRIIEEFCASHGFTTPPSI